MQKKKELLFLCGIKHSGKSSLARALASHTGLPYRDIDDGIIAAYPQYTSIRAIYRSLGKPGFMEAEVRALDACIQQLVEEPPLQTWRGYKGIIALGGGACDNLPAMQPMQTKGTSIYLQVAENVLLPRILARGVPPFLDTGNPTEAFHHLYLARHAVYSKYADFIVQLPDCGTVEDNFTYFLEQLDNFTPASG